MTINIRNIYSYYVLYKHQSPSEIFLMSFLAIITPQHIQSCNYCKFVLVKKLPYFSN